MTNELRKRRLKAKPLVYIIGILFITNLITLIAWISKEDSVAAGNETVATVGEEKITRQEWLHAIEMRHGKEVLQQLINDQVMEQSAGQHDISVTEEEVEREMSLLRSVLNVYDQASLPNEDVLRNQLKTELILEKLITADVTISEDEIRSYYEDNQALYDIPTLYRVSQIVVSTQEEASRVTDELAGNSSFEGLARERSIDEATASQGGLLGYVPDNSTTVPEEMLEALRSMDDGETSDVIPVEEGYAVVYLHDTIDGVAFEFEDVRDRIGRQLALEQLNVPVTAESFWNNYEIDWFYEETE